MDRAELDVELVNLNKMVVSAIAERTTWMDEHMAEYAKYHVGESIYDMRTGQFLGVISKLYRYWGGRDPQYDTGMNIEYEFKTPSGFFDNSSRHAGALWICNSEEMARHHENEAELLRLRAETVDPGAYPKVDWARVFGAPNASR